MAHPPATSEGELKRLLEERTDELRRAESQIQQLQKTDAIGRLAGGLAHDFNNMLGAITMYCDLAFEDAENPADVRDNVTQIRQVAERGAALTRQLLIFGRKQISRPETLRINDVVARLEVLLAGTLGESIELVLKLAPDLRLVRADSAQIEQAVVNLALNARDAMPSGGRLMIETSNVQLGEARKPGLAGIASGSCVLLRVSDTGVGMDAPTQARIFEPFFTTKPFGGGAGLGLTTVHGIVRQCDGAIRVESEPGRGAAFEIYLPAAADPLPEPGAKPGPPAVAASAGSRTILLTEDDEGLRLVFFKMLSRNGFDVLVAGNGAEALEICRRYEGPIALLMTDIVMPGMSGAELAREASRLRPEMRVLYMSGYANDALDDFVSGMSEPVHLIQKPFGTRALVDKIKSLLGEG
jgi:nitrogen-specific signal transduction histidine kinase